MTLNLVKILLAVTLFLFVAAGVSAQEEPEATTTDQQELEATSTEDVVIEINVSTSTVEETDLTEEELEEILEEAEVLEEDDIDTLEDLEGEIVAVTEDEVVIEQTNGDVVIVGKSVYEKKTSGSGSIAIGGYLGKKVAVGTAASPTSSGSVAITANNTTYTVPASTPVITKTGQTMTARDIKEGQSVAIVVGDSDEIIAVELIQSDTEQEREDSSALGIIIGIIVVIIVLFIIVKLRRKKRKI